MAARQEREGLAWGCTGSEGAHRSTPGDQYPDADRHLHGRVASQHRPHRSHCFVCRGPRRGLFCCAAGIACAKTHPLYSTLALSTRDHGSLSGAIDPLSVVATSALSSKPGLSIADAQHALRTPPHTSGAVSVDAISSYRAKRQCLGLSIDVQDRRNCSRRSDIRYVGVMHIKCFQNRGERAIPTARYSLRTVSTCGSSWHSMRSCIRTEEYLPW